MSYTTLSLGTSFKVSVANHHVAEFTELFSGEYSLENFPAGFIAQWFANNIGYDGKLTLSNNYWFQNARKAMEHYYERLSREAKIPQIAELREKGWNVRLSDDLEKIEAYGKYPLADLLAEGFCYWERFILNASDGRDYMGEFVHIQEQPLTGDILRNPMPGFYRDHPVRTTRTVDYLTKFIKFVDNGELNTPRPDATGEIVGEIESPETELGFPYEALEFTRYYGVYSNSRTQQEVDSDEVVLDSLTGAQKTSSTGIFESEFTFFLTNVPVELLVGVIEKYDHPTKTGYCFVRLENTGGIRAYELSDPTMEEIFLWLQETENRLVERSSFNREDMQKVVRFTNVRGIWHRKAKEGWILHEGSLYWAPIAPIKRMPKKVLTANEVIVRVLGSRPQIKCWTFYVQSGTLQVSLWETTRKKHFIGENGRRIEKVKKTLKPLGVKKILV